MLMLLNVEGGFLPRHWPLVDFANVFASLSLQKAKNPQKTKSPFRLSLGPLQSRSIRRFILKQGLQGDLWNYSWAVLCSGYKLQRYSMGHKLQWAWDILHYGEKGSLKPAGQLTTTATSLWWEDDIHLGLIQYMMDWHWVLEYLIQTG